MKRDIEDKKVGYILLCGGATGRCRKYIYVLKKEKLYRNLSNSKPHSCYPKKTRRATPVELRTKEEM